MRSKRFYLRHLIHSQKMGNFIFCLGLSLFPLFLCAQDWKQYFPQEIIDQYDIRLYNSESGFLRDDCIGLQLDDQNYLWINHYEGLSRLDANTLKVFNQSSLPGKEAFHFKLPFHTQEDNSFLLMDDNTSYHHLKQGKFYKLDSSITNDPRSLLDTICCRQSIFNEVLRGHFLKGSEHLGSGQIILVNKEDMFISKDDTLYYFQNYQLKNQFSIPKQLYLADIWPVSKNAFVTVAKSDPVYFYKITPQSIKSLTFLNSSQLPAIAEETFYPNLTNNLNGKTGLVFDKSIWQLGFQNDTVEAKRIFGQLKFRPQQVLINQQHNILILTNKSFGLFLLKKYNNFGLRNNRTDGLFTKSFIEEDDGSILSLNVRISKEGHVSMIDLPAAKQYRSNNLFWHKTQKGEILYMLGRSLLKKDQFGNWIKLFELPDSIPIARPRSVLENKNGEYWLAYTGCFVVLDQDFNLKFIQEAPFKHSINSLSCFYQLPNHDVWIGSNRGIYKFHGKDQLELLPMLSGYKVKHIQPFTDDYLLVHSIGEGLFLVNDNTAIALPLDTQERLRQSREALIDQTGKVWISTSNGLLVANQAEILAFAAGKVKSVYYHYFSTKDGLANNQFSGSKNCAQILADGQFAFSSNKGIIQFYPEEIYFDQIPKELHFEKILVDQKRIEPTNGRLKLPASYRQIEIHALPTAYWGRKENLKLEYRLKNYDDLWRPLEFGRPLQYSKLEYGKYVLEFRIHQGLDFIDIEDRYFTKSLSIYVQPKLTETLFFKLAATLGMLLLIVWGYRLRLSFLENRNRLLEEQVAKQTKKLQEQISAKNLLISILTHDIVGPFKFLTVLGRKIQSSYTAKDTEQVNDLNIMTTSLVTMYQQTQNYLDWVKTEHFKQIELGEMAVLPILKDTIQTLSILPNFQQKKIDVQISPEIKVRSHAVLLKVLFNNLIENTIKHNPESVLTIKAQSEGQATVLFFNENCTNSIDFQQLNAFFLNATNYSTLHLDTQQGIGFFIIKDVIQRSQGSIQLKKGPEGYNFIITFPNATNHSS